MMMIVVQKAVEIQILYSFPFVTLLLCQQVFRELQAALNDPKHLWVQP